MKKPETPWRTQVFFMKICIETQLYLRKTEYICENPIISAKIELYLRNGNYLISNDFFIAE